jgi:hypothetical protein
VEEVVFADRIQDTGAAGDFDDVLAHLGESEVDPSRAEDLNEVVEVLAARDVEVGVGAEVQIAARGGGSLAPASRLIVSQTGAALA